MSVFRPIPFFLFRAQAAAGDSRRGLEAARLALVTCLRQCAAAQPLAAAAHAALLGRALSGQPSRSTTQPPSPGGQPPSPGTPGTPGGTPGGSLDSPGSPWTSPGKRASGAGFLSEGSDAAAAVAALETLVAGGQVGPTGLLVARAFAAFFWQCSTLEFFQIPSPSMREFAWAAFYLGRGRSLLCLICRRK